MASALLEKVLLGLLGKYFEGLDRRSLKLSLLSGAVTLRNLEIRAEKSTSLYLIVYLHTHMGCMHARMRARTNMGSSARKRGYEPYTRALAGVRGHWLSLARTPDRTRTSVIKHTKELALALRLARKHSACVHARIQSQ
eukprot:2032382-Pleurochrysis_carterae.AAC.5